MHDRTRSGCYAVVLARTPAAPASADETPIMETGLVRSVRLPALIVLALLGGAPAGMTAEARPDAAAVEFFEKKVRPVLVASCFECHSAGKKRRGNLLADSRAGLLRGGDTGPALV